MKRISINNFLKMSPEAPEYSTKNPSYLISGANPTYYEDQSGIQEEQLAPLIASANWSQVPASLDGNVLASCSALYTTKYSIFLITTTGQVFGVKTNGTGVDSLGFPTGSAGSIISAKIVCVNNSLYVSLSSSDDIYYLPSLQFGVVGGVVTITIATPAVITLANHGFVAGNQVVFSTTGALPTGITAGTTYYVISGGLSTNTFSISTTSGGSAVNTTGTQSGVQSIAFIWNHTGSLVTGVYGTFLEPFLEYCMFSVNTKVRKLDSSFSDTDGIDLGSGWNIVGIKNYDNKYIAVAGQLGTGYIQNYIFLWDGISNTYNYAVTVPGRYIDMIVVDSQLYVAVAISKTKTSVYYLKNTSLAELLESEYLNIDSFGELFQWQDANCLFNYNNSLGIRLVSKQ